jgi:hypothetical protein
LPTCLLRYFIPFTGRFSTTPPHDPIEGFEIRPRFTILEEGRGFER